MARRVFLAALVLAVSLATSFAAATRTAVAQTAGTYTLFDVRAIPCCNFPITASASNTHIDTPFGTVDLAYSVPATLTATPAPGKIDATVKGTNLALELDIRTTTGVIIDAKSQRLLSLFTAPGRETGSNEFKLSARPATKDGTEISFAFTSFSGGVEFFYRSGPVTPLTTTSSRPGGTASTTKSGTPVPPTDDGASSCVVGDIDNLNFGFPPGFDPFSGTSTPVHAYPWTPNPADAPGMDRIMVGSGATTALDGYSGSTKRPDNSPQPIKLACKPATAGANVSLQLFVDDFQAPELGSVFSATVNGKPWPGLASVVNSLSQTGPIGRLITVGVPPDLVADVLSGSAQLSIDDATSGRGDGFAVDFVRIIVDPKPGSRSGTITGRVVDKASGAPLAGARVTAAGIASATTGADGRYTLTGVPAGLATPTANADGHVSQTRSADLVAGATVTVDFALEAGTDNSGLPRGFTIIAGQREVRAGDVVRVPVSVANTPNMANINVQIAYDPGVVQPEGTPVKGPFPPSAIFAANPTRSGVILFGVAAKAGASNGSEGAVIAQLGFRAVGKPGDRTPLTITVTTVDDPTGKALAIERIHGSITILDANGGLPGDCNGDHLLDPGDAECALYMSVRLRPVRLVVDIDKDGAVTSRDSTLILQQARG